MVTQGCSCHAGRCPSVLPGRPPSGFLLLQRERTLPDGRELRSPRPGRLQQRPAERPLLARRPPCSFHLLHRDRPVPARREGPSRFQELYGERPPPAQREVLGIPPCELLGLHGEPLLPLGREGPPSRLQELYGGQLPPLDREVLRLQPCSFQQLHREQQPQPPAFDPRATPGTSASSAPPGTAGAALTASSSARNTPEEEQSPAVDLAFAVEQMIREIRRSLSERSPSAQGNINAVPESSGGEPVDRAAAEEASSGTESCRNSSPEPEEPGKDRVPLGLERCKVAAPSLPLAAREISRVELLSAGLVLPGAFSSNPALAQPPRALPSTLLQRL
ncbi:serine/arginine repetitive matrix protein 1-like [Passer montanus]|uniref:serine/arginine repetitive matrix protein 1-like n=1 Tax=Passer montanus TaxID=9160 RepID=UPI001961562B|nr:serine/arginine repetitive matrix protein 1-like [Passer montanus]